MKHKAGFADKMTATVDRHKNDGFSVKSWWQWEQWRDGKLIREWECGNKVTNEGLNHILDVQFHAEAASATWYIAPFEDNYTPLAGDTYAVPGFTESTAYTEANRVAFNEAAASSQSITNSANRAEFTINATKTMYGAALFDDNTKDDQAAADAVMFCASAFGSSIPVISGDTLKVTVTITASDV